MTFGVSVNVTLSKNNNAASKTFGPDFIVDSAPAGISLDVALTSRCPLSCRYCTVEKAPARELNSKQWEEVIGSIAGLKSIKTISLEGGEPLSRKDLPEILASAVRHARQVKIVTSGFFSSHLPLSLVSDPRFSFEVSLDGPAPIHNFLRDQSHDLAFRFLLTCLKDGIRVRFRTVISRLNLPFYEMWLMEMDRTLEGIQEKVGFFFDTLIAPRPLLGTGGFVNRNAIREYPADGLIPTPHAIAQLFQRIKRRQFRHLDFIQDEPLRGCQAGKVLSLSLDPSGIYSYCCESPGGFGSILEQSPETCLSLLEKFRQDSSCHTCDFFANRICLGCWTGQKCGMVGHWGYAGCRDLFSSLSQGIEPPIQEKKILLSAGQRMEI